MIYIHTAMPAEAVPLISHYHLNKDTDAPVDSTWRKDNLSLIISGPGKLNAATTIAMTGERPLEMENPRSAWINIGIAWHTFLSPGEVCLAHSITDQGSRQCWYPQITFPVSCHEAPLITEDMPASDYTDQNHPEGALHDMEAAGFCAAALKFTHLERLHSLKVVSDNRQCPLSAAQAVKQAPELITNCLPVLDALIVHMNELNNIIARRTELPEGYLRLTEDRSHTVNERRQLVELLRQWQLHLPDKDLPWQEWGSLPTRQLLTRLRSQLHETVIKARP